MEEEVEEEEQQEEEENERNEVHFDLLSCILFLLTCVSLVITHILDIWSNFYHDYSQERFDYFHTFYLSLYYGNNTVSESEFLEDLKKCADDEESTRIQLDVRFVPEIVTFTYWWIAMFPRFFYRCLNFIHLGQQDVFENAPWIWKPCSYSLIFTLLIFKVMFQTLRVVQNLFQDPLTWDFKVHLIIVTSHCYLLFVMYYFVKMVVALLTVRVFYGEERFFREFIVSATDTMRYYFGIVCFNATVVLPLLLALKTIMWRPARGLRNIHEHVEEGNRIKRLFDKLYMTIFIADYSMIVTVRCDQGVVDATKTMFDLVNLGIPLRELRQLTNFYVKLAIWASVAYFAALKLHYINAEDMNFLKVSVESLHDHPMVVLALWYLVSGTVLNTRSICRWLDVRDLERGMAVAG